MVIILNKSLIGNSHVFIESLIHFIFDRVHLIFLTYVSPPFILDTLVNRISMLDVSMFLHEISMFSVQLILPSILQLFLEINLVIIKQAQLTLCFPDFGFIHMIINLFLMGIGDCNHVPEIKFGIWAVAF